MKRNNFLIFLFLLSTALLSVKTFKIYFPSKDKKVKRIIPITEKNKTKEIRPEGFNFSKQRVESLSVFDRATNNDLEWFKQNVNKIKDINAKNKYGTTLLAMAVGGEDYKLTELLLNKGANPNISFNKRNYTLLMDCALNGKAEIIKLLIKSKASLNEQDKEGKSALIYAVDQGNIEIVKELLKAGADINLKDIKGLSAKDYALMRNYQSILDLLKSN